MTARSTSKITEGSTDVRERLRKALDDEGVTNLDNRYLHSWRCNYRQIDGTLIYPPCRHVDDLLDLLMEAISGG